MTKELSPEVVEAVARVMAGRNGEDVLWAQYLGAARRALRAALPLLEEEIRADERERCVKVCERLAEKSTTGDIGWRTGITDCVEAILESIPADTNSNTAQSSEHGITLNTQDGENK